MALGPENQQRKAFPKFCNSKLKLSGLYIAFFPRFDIFYKIVTKSSPPQFFLWQSLMSKIPKRVFSKDKERK